MGWQRPLGDGHLNSGWPGARADEVVEAPLAVAAAEAAVVVRDSVLVTDADSATGELVVLRLILARCALCPKPIITIVWLKMDVIDPKVVVQ